MISMDIVILRLLFSSVILVLKILMQQIPMYRLGQCIERMEESNGGQLSQTSPCDKIIPDQLSLVFLPLKRIENRTTRILNGDHQLGETHWSNTCKDSQNVRVQMRLLAGSRLPDENPDDEVEGEVDHKADIWKTNQSGLLVMDSGRLLINLICIS